MIILNHIAQVDKVLFNSLFRMGGVPWLQYFARGCSKTGDGIPYVLVAGYLCYQQQAHDLLLVWTLLIGYAIERPVYYVTKNTFQRTRPCDCQNGFAYVTPSDKFSLPSGHSAAAWLFATVVSYFYPHLAPYLYCWASLVALSRVLLGVHYPLDVVLGSLMGYGFALLALQLTGVL